MGSRVGLYLATPVQMIVVVVVVVGGGGGCGGLFKKTDRGRILIESA